MPAGLSSSQFKLAKQIYRVGRRKKAKPKYQKAAMATAQVEANFSNPSGGDGTSAGWRQEIDTYGSVAKRTNVKGAASRFFNEAKQLDKGQSAWTLAQDVQRSAYPSRYREEKDVALRVLDALRKRELGGKSKGKRKSGSSLKAGTKTKTVRGTTKKLEFQKGRSNAEARQDLLRSYVLSGASEDPKGRLNLALGLADLADEPGSLSVKTKPTKQKVKVGTTRKVEAKGGKDRRKKGESSKGLKSGGDWDRTQHLARYAVRVAKRRGHSISSRKRTSTFGNPGSDHYVGNKNAYAVDIPATGSAGKKLAKRIAKKYGIKGDVTGTYDRRIVKDNKGRKFSIQILWAVEGHYDHVHVGLQRV